MAKLVGTSLEGIGRVVITDDDGTVTSWPC